MFSKIKEKILALSNSYVFYKKNYENLSIEYDKVLKENTELKNENTTLKSENRIFKTLLDEYNTDKQIFDEKMDEILHNLNELSSDNVKQISITEKLLEDTEEISDNQKIFKNILSNITLLNNEQNMNVGSALTHLDTIVNQQNSLISDQKLYSNDILSNIQLILHEHDNSINNILSNQNTKFNDLSANIRLNDANLKNVLSKEDSLEVKLNTFIQDNSNANNRIHELLANQNDVNNRLFDNNENLLSNLFSSRDSILEEINNTQSSLAVLDDKCLRMEKSSEYTNIKLDSKFNEYKRLIEEKQ